jgi:hypothetical protein
MTQVEPILVAAVIPPVKIQRFASPEFPWFAIIAQYYSPRLR